MKTWSKEVPPAEHKGLKSEDLGNITGRRGAGLTTVGGGDQLLHSLSHYGKDPPMMPGYDAGVPISISQAMQIQGLRGRRR